MYEIIPSPGTEDKTFEEIDKKIKSLDSLTHTIHIDVIDGIFAQNTTFNDASAFSKLAQSMRLEVHLMVKEPINYLKQFADSGFRRFIGQVEQMSDQVEFVAQGELLGDVGLAIDLNTSVDAIKVPLSDLDTILVMCVQAGFSGQEFNEKALEKVKKLREMNDILPIEVDGGISDRTILKARDAGATKFVTTSYLFDKDVNPYRQLQEIDKLLFNDKS